MIIGSYVVFILHWQLHCVVGKNVLKYACFTIMLFLLYTMLWTIVHLKIVWFSNSGQSWTTLYTQCTHEQLSVLYGTTSWLHPGLSRGFVDIFRNCSRNLSRTDKKMHSGGYRVAPGLRINACEFICANVVILFVTMFTLWKRWGEG